MALHALILFWLALGAVQDWQYRTVPNALLLPGLLAGLLYRLTVPPDGSAWVILGVLLLLGLGVRAGWVGGADAKATLGLALFSLPLVLWAWGGLVGWWVLLRIFSPRKTVRRWPGFIGFAAGAAAGWIYRILF